MLHPRTAEARDLVAAMRKRFALAWPWQKVLLESEDGAPLDTELARAIEAGLIPAEPMSEEEERRGVEWFVGHAQSFEAAAHCILPFVLRHRGNLSELPERARRLLLERANPRKCWVEVSAAAGFTSTTEAMRHLRFALRLLLEQRTTAS
jgi:hypothetical protein